ncbi:hypothetical protein [Paenibacillus sp. 23TSA30-6]|uniref:hypothetical protein n=1 Tax=Paenibacillus sp. 23TSA30-6 TaxID=2546104 RepID=UPI0017883B41|nr:hypothetical protein [Paenibacillus sp. 23TSA30-6]MBE0335756.1 hypothetical protein [Paenibacillus sp. 23TSA30-6]
MNNLDEKYLKKRIEILLEWKSVLLRLAEDELSPFVKWCAENELSQEDQHFITNLCLLFQIHLHPDQGDPEVKNIMRNIKGLFNVDVVEISFESFQDFIEKYQQDKQLIHEWDAREVLEKLAESNRSIELKEKLLG